MNKVNLVCVLPVDPNPVRVADRMGTLFQEAGAIFLRQEGCRETARMFYHFADQLKNYQPPLKHVHPEIRIN